MKTKMTMKKNSKAFNYMQTQSSSAYHYATDGYGRIMWLVIITLSAIALFVSMASSDGAHRPW